MWIHMNTHYIGIKQDSIDSKPLPRIALIISQLPKLVLQLTWKSGIKSFTVIRVIKSHSTSH